jgi:NAD(P)-dependent dehydrogenase (short-subunit alcohol dehydrogenase family)
MKHVEGVAFITGGASGIGFGMAQVFLKSGMKVIIADVLQERLDEAARILAASTNRDYHFIKVDVTDRKAMAAAAAEAERVFGKVHVLCNNAGVYGNLPIESATYDDWDWVLGTNLGGVINGLVSFLPKIIAHGEGGHIVNTSSMAGLIPLPSAGGLYATSKFAVRGLTDSLRLALGSHNIGVSVLCPGMTRTKILEAEQHRPGHEPDVAGDSEKPDLFNPTWLTGWIRSSSASACCSAFSVTTPTFFRTASSRTRCRACSTTSWPVFRKNKKSRRAGSFSRTCAVRRLLRRRRRSRTIENRCGTGRL